MLKNMLFVSIILVLSIFTANALRLKIRKGVVTALPDRISNCTFVYSSTAPNGGNGGAPYTDSDIAPELRFAGFDLRSGSYLDAIRVVSVDKDGKEVYGNWHGGNGGAAASIRLQPGQRLAAYKVFSGSLIDSIEFFDNNNVSLGKFGGNGGGPSPMIPIIGEVYGCKGRSGSLNDNLAFLTRENVCTVEKCNDEVFETNAVGGQGGLAFDDAITTPSQWRLAGVDIRSGIYVDGIRLLLVDAEGKQTFTSWHGNGDGPATQQFRVNDGEQLTAINVWAAQFVVGIQFVTNQRTTDRWGTNPGTQTNFPITGELFSLKGRSGSYVDQIAFVYHQTTCTQTTGPSAN